MPSLNWGRERDAKPEEVARARRRSAETGGRPAVGGAGVPTAAAAHAAGPVGSACRIGPFVRAVLAVPIAAPLPDIARHVVQAPAIRLPAADVVRGAVGIGSGPGQGKGGR